MGDLNYFHGNGKVPYGDHFGRGLGSGGGPGEGGQGGAPKLKCSDFHNLDVYGIPMGRPTSWCNYFLKILNISMFFLRFYYRILAARWRFSYFLRLSYPT